MKKPVLIKTTPRLFPDEESEATTAPQITIEGRITDPLSYSYFKGRTNLFTRISNKGINPYRFGIETLGQVRENGNKASVLLLRVERFCILTD
jgi:hypothetical protein